MLNPSIARRDFLRMMPLLGLAVIAGHKTKAAAIDTAVAETPVNNLPLSNRAMHWVNPTLSSSLPAIAAEFYEAKVLIANNFVKHMQDSHSSEDALRYDNADAYSRPWAGLVVQLGAILSRYPANFLATAFTASPQMQSRFASMFSYYTIVGEVKYLRNPVLGELRDAVRAELNSDPSKYKNDPKNIPLLRLLSKLCERRADLIKDNISIDGISTQELNLRRSAIDLLIFAMSLASGLMLNASSGKAIGGLVGTACILRDVVARESKKGIHPDELSKLRDRTRAEMITWPSLFSFNAILQNMIHVYMPKLFPGDNLAQEHLVEMIGNLCQAGVYCVGKTNAQSKLEMASELGNQDWWKVVDWYVQS